MSKQTNIRNKALKAWPNDDIPTLCEYVSAELVKAVASLDAKYPAT